MVLRIADTVCGNKNIINWKLRFGFFGKNSHTLAQFPVIIVSNSILFCGEFHLAQVDQTVRTFNHQINLGSIIFAAPRANRSDYSTDSQGFLYLLTVQETKQFKTEPLPRQDFLCGGYFLPKISAKGQNDSADLLNEALAGITDNDLKVLCRNSFTRTMIHLKYGDSTIETCFDRGTIEDGSGRVREYICELELELVSGRVEDIEAMAGIVIDNAPCGLFNDTKYHRTLKYIDKGC